jgi:hypothetical protein
MTTITINTERELKQFVDANRKSIREINGTKFNENYPILTCSNKHAHYYSHISQDDIFLKAPFAVSIIESEK